MTDLAMWVVFGSRKCFIESLKATTMLRYRPGVVGVFRQ